MRQPLHQTPPATALMDLGAGEREAIALARELPTALVLIDERDRRRAAQAQGLRVAGIFVLLERAAIRGLIDLSGATDAFYSN